jgi:hypothetical protein
MIICERMKSLMCEKRGDGEKQKRGENHPLYITNPLPIKNALNPDDLIPCTLKHDQLFHIRN